MPNDTEIREFVLKNYYRGDMDVEDIVAYAYANGSETVRGFLSENYYEGDMDAEEIMAAL